VVKLSLLILAALTLLIGYGLRWREGRQAALQPVPARRGGWVAAKRRALDRWLTAATLATLVTILVLGGLHWLRVWQG
jgi:hypothetical protein